MAEWEIIDVEWSAAGRPVQHVEDPPSEWSGSTSVGSGLAPLVGIALVGVGGLLAWYQVFF